MNRQKLPLTRHFTELDAWFSGMKNDERKREDHVT